MRLWAEPLAEYPYILAFAGHWIQYILYILYEYALCFLRFACFLRVECAIFDVEH